MLTVTPWSSLWEQNYFAELLPGVAAVANTSAVRGAVTGIGLLTAVAGMVELAGTFGWGRAEGSRGERQ